MRDVIGGIASRIHIAGSSFVLAPPQQSQSPPLEGTGGSVQREAALPGTLISSGSLPQRVRHPPHLPHTL